MNPAGQLVGTAILVAVVWLVFHLIEDDRRVKLRKSVAVMDGIAEQLRSLLRAGDWDGFTEAEARAWDTVDELARDDANLVATSLSLVRAEYGVVRGLPDEVREGLAAATENATRIPASERRELGLQALAIAGIALDPATPDEDFERRGEEAIARSGEALWVRTRVLIVQASVQLARMRRTRGESAAADEIARRALELAGQPDVEEARSLASIVAGESALHHLDAGDAAGAARWFDLAEAAVSSDESPASRRQRAFLLLVRAVQAPGDPLLDAGTRRVRLERAREATRDLERADARQLFARASSELAQVHGAAGEHVEAVACFGEALVRLAGQVDPPSTRMRIETRISCGHARLAAQDLTAAGDFQLAMDEAAAHEDPALRALALPAAYSLAGMLASSGMHEHAAEVLDRARAVAESGPDADRALALARVAYERSSLDRRSGLNDRAREQLLGVLDATGGEAPGAAELRRAALASLGRTALATGDPAEAEARLREALAMEWDDQPESDAERAEQEWHLATAQVQLGRITEARATYERAFERGRASGLRDGRYAAGQAALQLAEHSDLAAERRRWYEAAVALAKLCGSSEGEALARHAANRMRARAAGED